MTLVFNRRAVLTTPSHAPTHDSALRQAGCLTLVWHRHLQVWCLCHRHTGLRRVEKPGGCMLPPSRRSQGPCGHLAFSRHLSPTTSLGTLIPNVLAPELHGSASLLSTLTPHAIVNSGLHSKRSVGPWWGGRRTWAVYWHAGTLFSAC